MKILKKILIGFAILLVVLIAAAAILPSFFKDDIKAAIDKSIAENVNADVVFDVNNFSLSIFRHFPSITAEIKDLGVFNRAPFEGEHLFVVNRLEVEINLSDLLFGDKVRIKGITLVKPQINIKVLPDGRANYDISIPSKDTLKTAEEPSKFSFGIDHWEVIDGDVVYDDQSIPYFLSMNGLDHTGSGDFTQDVFDLKTQTTADTVNTSMGSMQFLANKHAEVTATISISENISKFTFKENSAKINDFALGFDGWFKMNPDNYEMDISYKSPENSFKSLLSLVPGMYTKDFKNIETKGDLLFTGFVRGKYSEKQLPAFNLDLKVNDAMFRYPDLPSAINNINMDLLVDNKDGVIDNTVIDLKKLHLEFGSNPVDAKWLIENLKNYKMDGNIKAVLNLSEFSKMFPMEGVEMKGICSFNASAKGVYDKEKKIVPVSGSGSLHDFSYSAQGLPSVTISQAEMSFDPGKMELSKMKGTVGKSDFDVNGQVSHYIEYAVKGSTISGLVNFKSNLFDLNEFMTDEGSTTKTDTASLKVIPIPQNIDFTLKSAINTVKMMDYTMTDARGDIVLKDGVANLSGLKFNMLGGAFVVNGNYNTKDVKHPKYDFDLKIENMAIQQAANAFSIVKTYAPIAGLVTGNFSTDFKVNGELKQNMMPDLKTVNGGGLVKIAQAVLTQSKIISGVSSLTNLNNTSQVNLKDVLMSTSISNGRLSVKPFDVSIGNYPTTITGSTGLDGSIDYSLKMMVPAGQLGSQLQGYIGKYTGSKPTDKIPVTIGLTGNYNNPKASLITADQKKQIQEEITKQAEQKGQEAAKQIIQGKKPEDVVNNLLGGNKTDTTKVKKDSTATEQGQDILQNKLQNLLKKKKN